MISLLQRDMCDAKSFALEYGMFLFKTSRRFKSVALITEFMFGSKDLQELEDDAGTLPILQAK